MKNYYAVLGLTPSADDEAIKTAYRQNAKRYHPDLNPDNESFKVRFLEIKAAYEILGNAESRKKYDSEIAAYLKAKQAQNTARQKTQQAAQSTVHHQTQPRPQAQMQQTINPQVGKMATKMEIEKLKKMHSLQLELMRVSAKESMLKYRKRLQEQLDGFKKEAVADREKERRQHKETLDKMLAKIKEYKTAQKKDSFNDGFKKGMKAAQDSSKKTIDELKKILVDNQKKESKDSSNKKVQSLQLELSLINEKNRELNEQIKLLERINVTDNSDDALKLELEQASDKIESLTAQIDSLKTQIIGYESEIDSLNEEILYLEGFSEIWQDVIADNTVTEEELLIIQEYENMRNTARGTLYEVLGLPVNALPDEIEVAFQRLKKRYEGKEAHASRYEAVLNAYSILSNSTKKSAYDAEIDNEADL